jgi:alpha-L-fucosidase 2
MKWASATGVVLAAAAAACAQPAPLVIKAPITRWDEAIPLGNGIMGGLLWGEGNLIRLSLDRGDLWDERVPDMLTRPDWTYARMRELKEAGDHKTHIEMFDVPYDTVPYPTKLPGGRLEISLDPALAAKSFTLDLESAEASVDLAPARLTAFCSQHSPVAMLRIRGTRIAPDAIALIRPAGLDKLGYDAATTGSEDLALNGGRTATLRWMTQRAALGLEYTIAFGLADDSAGQVIVLSITAHRAPTPLTRLAATSPPRYGMGTTSRKMQTQNGGGSSGRPRQSRSPMPVCSGTTTCASTSTALHRRQTRRRSRCKECGRATTVTCRPGRVTITTTSIRR